MKIIITETQLNKVFLKDHFLPMDIGDVSVSNNIINPNEWSEFEPQIKLTNAYKSLNSFLTSLFDWKAGNEIYDFFINYYRYDILKNFLQNNQMYSEKNLKILQEGIIETLKKQEYKIVFDLSDDIYADAKWPLIIKYNAKLFLDIEIGKNSTSQNMNIIKDNFLNEKLKKELEKLTIHEITHKIDGYILGNLRYLDNVDIDDFEGYLIDKVIKKSIPYIEDPIELYTTDEKSDDWGAEVPYAIDSSEQYARLMGVRRNMGFDSLSGEDIVIEKFMELFKPLNVKNNIISDTTYAIMTIPTSFFTDNIIKQLLLIEKMPENKLQDIFTSIKKGEYSLKKFIIILNYFLKFSYPTLFIDQTFDIVGFLSNFIDPEKSRWGSSGLILYFNLSAISEYNNSVVQIHKKKENLLNYT